MTLKICSHNSIPTSQPSKPKTHRKTASTPLEPIWSPIFFLYRHERGSSKRILTTYPLTDIHAVLGGGEILRANSIIKKEKGISDRETGDEESP